MSAIGIDLGTTNCCVAYVKDGKDVRIIQDKTDGERVLPSCILFGDRSNIIGKHAQKRLAGESNKIHDIKRLMGMKLCDVNIEHFHYTILNERNRLKVHIKTKNREFILTPEEISALLLKRLKESAENYLDNIEKAVITVPAYFNERQRKATIDAGKIAGFKEVQLLNEPTAAAIAYAFDQIFHETKTILIFDFGGGTFDVSIVRIIDKNLEVLGIGGDPYLGGNDIDTNLLNYVIEQLQIHYNIDLVDHRKIERLRSMCKTTKEELSSKGVNISKIELMEMIPDDVIDIEVDIIKFDELNDEIYKKILGALEVCLQSANLGRNEIDEVVMVGGSSKIKKINSMLVDFFGKELRYNINPDEAVAIGAAIQASIWSDPQSSQYKDVKFNDISTYTLGVETQGEKMSILIPKHTPLPATNSKLFQTTVDYQESVLVRVFSGESNISRENNFLGDLRVRGFPLGPAGSVILKETFNLNKNGMLEITVSEERSKDNLKKLQISLDESGSLQEEEIERFRLNIENLYGS